MRLDNTIRARAFNDKQRALYEAMSDISEDCYCAGWMDGNEYAIWGALQTGDRRYGMGEMERYALEKCRTLSHELGGWIIWLDDEAGLPIEEWGPAFVPMAQWLDMAAAEESA